MKKVTFDQKFKCTLAIIFIYLSIYVCECKINKYQYFNKKKSFKEINLRQSLLQVNLQSQNSTKTIPILRESSCQLTIFVFYDNQFVINLDNIPQQVNLIKIQLKTLNKTYQSCPKDKKLSITIDIQQNNQNQVEITQYFIMTGKKSSQVVKQSQFLLLQNQLALEKVQLQAEQEQIIFEQVRKVYLIKSSNQQWYIVALPQNAILLTSLLAFFLVILLSHNIKYRRFTPLNFGLLFAILYSAFIFIIVYIDQVINYIVPEYNIKNLQIPKFIIALSSLVLIFIYLQDLLNKGIQKKRVIIPIAFVISLTILVLDLFIFVDYWYINNIIAILISGCIIKFIVIRKLKTSILPLSILWIFSIVRQFIHIQSVAQEVSLQIFPLHLQIPACFNDNPDGYSCSAFGVSKIIIMGLIINYSIRIDIFISSKFYQICNLVIAFICLFLQYWMDILNDQIPVMQYLSVAIFLPLSIIFMLIFANKRGQWAIIWHGSFYDMAVNRASIRKNQNDITSIEQSFGTTLILGSILTDNTYVSK